MFYVYGLHLEGDDEIRYVGSTCNPNKRFLQHLYGHDDYNPQKTEWTESCGSRLRMKVLYSDVPEKDRRRVEQRAINECKKKGYRLLNHRGAKRHAADVRDVTWWLDYLGDHEVK